MKGEVKDKGPAQGSGTVTPASEGEPINAGIVAGIRMSWETNATSKLRRQLVELRQPGREVEIALGYFEIPVGERLKAWGVRFQNKGRKAVRDGSELMSVVEGYPGAVKYRVISDQ